MGARRIRAFLATRCRSTGRGDQTRRRNGEGIPPSSKFIRVLNGPFHLRKRRSRKIGGLSQARALGQPAPQFSGSLLRGHGWALSGLQAIHPVPLLRSWTPVESACPRHSGHVDAAPAIRTTRASALVDFEADSRSFGTCSPTLRATIAVTRKAGFRLADWPLPGGS